VVPVSRAKAQRLTVHGDEHRASGDDTPVVGWVGVLLDFCAGRISGEQYVAPGSG